MDALQCTVPMSYIVAQYRLQRQAFSNAFYGHPVYRTLQIRSVPRTGLPTVRGSHAGQRDQVANDRLFASATSRIAPGAYRPLDL